MVAQPPGRAGLPLKTRSVQPHAMKARLLAELVQAMSAEQPLLASTVALLVGRTARALMQQALSARQQCSATVEECLQLHLRNVVTLVGLAERHFGNVLLAVHWYRTDRLAQGAEHTPEALTAAGRPEDAWLRLQEAKGRQ